MAVGPLAGQGDEQPARPTAPRIDGAAADRAGRLDEEPAAGRRATSVGGREGRARRDRPSARPRAAASRHARREVVA